MAKRRPPSIKKKGTPGKEPDAKTETSAQLQLRAGGCLKFVTDALREGGEEATGLTEADAVEIVDSIIQFIKQTRYVDKPGFHDLETLEHEARKYIVKKGKEQQIKHIVEAKEQVATALAFAKARNYLKNFTFNHALGIEAFLGGTQRGEIFAGRHSIDAIQAAMANKVSGRFIRDLMDADLLDILKSRAIDRDVMIEIFEMKPGGRPGRTKNKNAIKAAEVINKWDQSVRQRANLAGAFILPRPEFLFKHSFDMLKLRKHIGPEGDAAKIFREDIGPLLDHGLTFSIDMGKGNIGVQKTKFLDEAYAALSSGVHYRLGSLTEHNTIGFAGKGNVGRRLSRSPVFRFKDGESWFKFNEKYGSGSILEQAVFGLRHTAESTVLMEHMGPNPAQFLEQLVEEYVALNIGNKKVQDRFSGDGIRNLMSRIDGSGNIPGNLTGARIGAGFRFIENMANLGLAVISAITDIPIAMSQLRQSGIHPLDAYFNQIVSVFRGRTDGEAKRLAMMMGAGVDGIIGEILSKFGANDQIPGILSRANRLFFKINGMTWWNDSQKTGFVYLLSNSLAQSSNLSYKKLDADTNRLLRQFGINSDEWDIIRATKYKAESGSDFITPDKIDELPDGPIQKLLAKEQGVEIDVPETVVTGAETQTTIKEGSPEGPIAREVRTESKEPAQVTLKTFTKSQVNRRRNEISDKLQNFFQDQSDTGIPIPRAQQEANFIMQGSSRPGTWIGETRRLFSQFKSFPLTMMQRVVGRDLLRGVSDDRSIARAMVTGQSDMYGFAQLVAGLTVFGYLSISLKDLARGRTPPDPTRFATIKRAMAQGGALGIYGDFLFGEYNTFGRSFLKTLAGPTLGQADALADAWTRLQTGEQPLKAVTRLGINNVPGINLFYTRIALDYLILNQLHETVNPGYQNRLSKRLKEDFNQRVFIK